MLHHKLQLLFKSVGPEFLVCHTHLQVHPLYAAAAFQVRHPHHPADVFPSGKPQRKGDAGIRHDPLRKSLDFQVRFHSPYLLPSNSLGARIRVDTLSEELHALAIGILQQLDVQGKSQYV